MEAREYVEKLRMGKTAGITSRELMTIGDELLALLDGRQIGLAQLDRSTAEKVREILVEAGALSAMDFETSPLDLLAVLLPPLAES